MQNFTHPLKKLRALSSSPKQIWVVAYVNQVGQSPLVDQAYSDIEASFEGGADAVVLINEWSSLEELENTLIAVRKRYPNRTLGVNYLGDDLEPYGYLKSFELARKYQLQIAWTDFSGVDLIKEKPEISLHAIEKVRPHEVFYCSGVHMKYSTLLNSEKTIEISALQAMGWVDGIVLTGSKTGEPCDPEKVKRARHVVGTHPIGIASGVSPENIGTLSEYSDFFLVASSLQDGEKRIVMSKVRDLKNALL